MKTCTSEERAALFSPGVRRCDAEHQERSCPKTLHLLPFLLVSITEPCEMKISSLPRVSIAPVLVPMQMHDHASIAKFRRSPTSRADGVGKNDIHTADVYLVFAIS